MGTKTSRSLTDTENPLSRARARRIETEMARGTLDPLRLVDELAKEKQLRNRVEAQLKSASRENGKLREELSATRAKRDHLARQLEKQTIRVDKFKDAYNSLRGRRWVRVAGLLSDPSRMVRKFVRPVTESAWIGTPVPSAPFTAAGAAETASPILTEQAAPDTLPQSNSGQKPIEAMREQFDAGWLRGALDALGAPRDDESSAEKFWRNKLNGQISLLERFPMLPPRSLAPGLQPVRGRVMYCAHSTAEYQSNGYSTRTSHLVSALGAAGEDVLVVARPGYPWDTTTDKRPPVERRVKRRYGGLDYFYNPGLDWSRTPLDVYVQQATDVYVREALLHRPAVIHSASNYFTALPALIAARRLGLPFVYEVRGLWEVTELAARGRGWENTERFQLAARLESFVAANADRVLAITDEVRAELVARGVEPDRIGLLPNAADPAAFVPTPRDRGLANALRIAPDDFVIGYAGSMVAYEGLDLLVRAFEKVYDQLPNARLVLVGDGKERKALEHLVDDLDLAAAVTFTGRVKPTMVRKYLSLFDIAPCPRRSNVVTEMVSPLKPLEAMAAGIPVIGSDVAPIKHLLGQEQERGHLFAAGDADALADALIELGQAPEQRADIGRTARSWAVKYRSWAEIARCATATHQELMDAGYVSANQGSLVTRTLASIRLGLIADEFTFATFGPECRTTALYPETWHEALETEPLDVLLVESAWAGNGGAWTRGVGFYSDEDIAPLKALVEACRTRGIPTIFWNKEDPVHTERFIRTSTLFDHVFTTDADCIRRYATEGAGTVRTVASLPFFAQATLHHPFSVARPYEHSVAYGGSYYGDRYPDRSAELSRILGEVEPHGLTIYDRQVNHENSPYRFPEQLAPHVRGGLDYSEMVAAYKSHPVHVNVNSVDKSPTMFSRRVMELAGCGTPVISGRGRGVTTLFGDLLPLAAKAGTADLLADYWLNEEAGRNADGWRLHRHVYRAHLATHRLAYMLRTAGLPIDVEGLPGYILEVGSLTRAVADTILKQTHRPLAVHSENDASSEAVDSLRSAGIETFFDARELPGVSRAWFGDALIDPEIAEDLARSLWLEERIAGNQALARAELQAHDVDEPGKTLLVKRKSVTGAPWFGREPVEGESVIGARRAVISEIHTHDERTLSPIGTRPQTVLVAGHDLKFARTLIERLQSSGHTLLIDEWQDHAKHDPEQSRRLLADADVVFCEWSLGNAEWYARHVRPDQRLVVRLHSQELFTPYPERTEAKRFDATIYVGRLVRDMAVSRLGYPKDTARVIPNAVDAALFNEEKQEGSRFNVGLVGIVPQQKHLDRALDVLRQLRVTDQRYQLFIKGKTPHDYPWMLKRDDEMSYYNAQYARIAEDPLLQGAVHFDGHGDDMAEWYQKIGVVLSVSDFESFHLTLADGGATGALPVSLAWPGAEHIYPEEWLHLTVGSMAEKILQTVGDEAAYGEATRSARDYCQRFHADLVLGELERVVLG